MQPSQTSSSISKTLISVRSILLFVLKRIAGLAVTLWVVTIALFSMEMFYNLGRVDVSMRGQVSLIGLISYYGYWIQNLVAGDWGYSFSARDDVLPALIHLSPATAELALYSILTFIPLGILSGMITGWRKGSRVDRSFQFTAFVATSIPPFILAIFLLGTFYVGLHWFPPGRLGDTARFYVTSDAFTTYTGLLTIDGLLNRRPDISLDALRHLVLPVITLSLYHWATLSRVTRVAVHEELGKEYILAARARGVAEGWLLWRHTLRNVLVPILNSTMLSASSLFTGVFVVEAVYDYDGVSTLIRNALAGDSTDIMAALGFGVYSAVIVLAFMTLLDVLQAIVDPRIREGQAA